MSKKLLGLMMILILSFTPIRADKIDSILIKSLGGAEAVNKLENIKTISQTGTVNMNGLVGTFHQKISIPDKFFLEIEFPNFSLKQVYDGATAWQQSMNGQVAEISENEKKELLKSLFLSSYAYFIPENVNMEKYYLGTAEKNNSLYDLVNFIPYKNDTIQIWFDSKTGNRTFVTARHDLISTTTIESDYRIVEGIKYPFSSEAEIKSANFNMSIQIETLRFNENIDHDIFKYPLSSEIDYYFPNQKSMTIPIDYKNGHIRVNAILNGKKHVWMILDSGAATNILNITAVQSLDIPRVGTLPGMGVSGIEDVALLQTDSIQIGNLTLLNQVVGAMDLQGLANNQKIDLDFGGIIGYDFLSRFPTLIDYKKKELTVFNPENKNLPEGGITCPFTLTMQIPTVKAAICGKSGDFIVDLGNAFGVILHKQYIEQESLFEQFSDVKLNYRTIGGIGGNVTGYKAFAPLFTIDSLSVQNLEILVPEKSIGITGSEDIAGNIGNLFLENFKVLLNYDKNEIILFPNQL